jgi:hypothetical protein
VKTAPRSVTLSRRLGRNLAQLSGFEREEAGCQCGRPANAGPVVRWPVSELLHSIIARPMLIIWGAFYCTAIFPRFVPALM